MVPSSSDRAAMFNFFKRGFRPQGLPVSAGGRLVTETAEASAFACEEMHPFVNVLRYPPIDPGLPAVPVNAILASQRDLIDRLRQVAAFDEPTFQRRCVVPIEGVARYIHLLPASAFEHFAGPGGLFRLCIEMALYSRQAAEGRMFVASASVEMRRQLEPRWKYACFLAGLLSELHRPLGTLVVTDGAGRTWPAFLGSLDAWLRAVGAAQYHVAWLGRPLGTPASAEGAAVFGDIIPKEALAWLNEASPALVAEVFGTALGQAVPGGGVSAVLDATRERVFHVEASTRRSRYGHLRLGHHLELHLIDAIRQRVAVGQWAAGSHEGPLWFGTDGLFLEWPVAAITIRDDVMRNGVTGIPLCAFTMAEALGRAGLLTEASPADWLWRVHVDPANPTHWRTALKFAEPRSVLGYAEVLPSDCRFGVLAPPNERLPFASSAAISPGLAPAEIRMVDSWRQCLDTQRPDLLAWLPSGGLALSKDLLALSGTDLASAATALHRRQWLGRGDWPSPEARVGLLAFAGTLKPGLVLNEVGARHLGLLAAKG